MTHLRAGQERAGQYPKEAGAGLRPARRGAARHGTARPRRAMGCTCSAPAMGARGGRQRGAAGGVGGRGGPRGSLQYEIFVLDDKIEHLRKACFFAGAAPEELELLAQFSKLVAPDKLHQTMQGVVQPLLLTGEARIDGLGPGVGAAGASLFQLLRCARTAVFGRIDIKAPRGEGTVAHSLQVVGERFIVQHHEYSRRESVEHGLYRPSIDLVLREDGSAGSSALSATASSSAEGGGRLGLHGRLDIDAAEQNQQQQQELAEQQKAAAGADIVVNPREEKLLLLTDGAVNTIAARFPAFAAFAEGTLWRRAQMRTGAFLRHIAIFQLLTAREREVVAQTLEYVEVQRDTVLVDEMEEVDNFYIVCDAVLEASSRPFGVFRRFGPGTWCCETALLKRRHDAKPGPDCTRVVAVSAGVVLRLQRAHFKSFMRLVACEQSRKRIKAFGKQRLSNALQAVNAFMSYLPEHVLDTLADNMTSQYVGRGDVLDVPDYKLQGAMYGASSAFGGSSKR